MARRRPIGTASPTLRAIFEAAEASGISQSELALRIGSRQHEIHRWRRGTYSRTPNILTVEELANAVGYRLELIRTDGAANG
jgi:ribosome-binding protein aMBF1 (putative translation factor)